MTVTATQVFNGTGHPGSLPSFAVRRIARRTHLANPLILTESPIRCRNRAARTGAVGPASQSGSSRPAGPRVRDPIRATAPGFVIPGGLLGRPFPETSTSHEPFGIHPPAESSRRTQ